MAESPKILIVEARYYEDVADHLAAGAVAVIEKGGFTTERISVPGIFEIPAALKFALHAKSGQHAGYLALGCIIRGETDHYDHIARETSRALMDLALDNDIAFGFGVLPCENKKQADVRAAPESEGGRNKGAEAAEACLRMIELKKQFQSSSP